MRREALSEKTVPARVKEGAASVKSPRLERFVGGAAGRPGWLGQGI